MDLKEQFLDKDNINLIYKLVNYDLKKKQVKVTDKTQYKKVVKKLCKSITKSRAISDILSLLDLNNYAVTKIVPFVMDIFKDKQIVQDNTPLPLGNDEALNNIYSNIGLMSNLTDNIDGLDNLGNITDSTNDDTLPEIESKDIAIDNDAFLLELKKKREERNYDPDPNFRESVKIAEQKTRDRISEPNKFVGGDDNDFFKNLYENNLTAAQPNIISKEQKERNEQLTKLKDKFINKQVSDENMEFLNVKNMELNYESITENNPTPFTSILKDQNESNVINFETSDNKEIQELDKKFNSTVELYAPGKYINNRENTEYLVLDMELGESVPSWEQSENQLTQSTTTNMIANLSSSLNIDKQSNVILEFLSLQNVFTNNSLNRFIEEIPFFVIYINEIESKIVSNNPNLINKFVIPNESYGKSTHETSTNKNTLSTVNVKLKTNYLTTINPNNFLRLTISIWGLSNQSVDDTNLLNNILVSEQDNDTANTDSNVNLNKIQVSIFNDIRLNQTIAFNNTATELNTGYSVQKSVGDTLTELSLYEITFGNGDKCAGEEDDTIIVKLTSKLDGSNADNLADEMLGNTTILFFDKLLISSSAVISNAPIAAGEFNIKSIKKVKVGSSLIPLYGESDSRVLMGLLFKKI